ncbi:uncharacterized protein LOC143293378 [Babylonia areolata]|uniref:uncharacterized protein LOC143293378 n=1 Tax=Babylonia areolata TaxID=304850 RepID=UPI003FD3EF12
MSVSHPLLKLLKVSVLEVHREVGCIRDSNLKLHPLCQIVEDIFRLGLLRTGSWFNKVDYWNVFIKLSRRAGPGVYHILEFVKESKKTMTDQGRGRLFIRGCLARNQLACAVRLLKGDPVVLNTHYDPSSSIVRDDILIEIFLSLLEEVQRITFRLNLKNSSFLDETWELAELRDLEFVPCEVLGIQFQSVEGHFLVTDVEKTSVAAEDNKVQVGDILDEMFGHSLKGAKKSKVKELFQLYKGIPVYASFIKAKDSNGHIHRHVAKLLRKADIVMVTPSRQRRRAARKPEGESSGAGSGRKPVHAALLPEDEQDEIPVHGPDGRVAFDVIYRGQHSLKSDGRVDRIHDAVGAIVHNPDQLDEVVTICTTETTIVVTRKSDGKRLMEHSYPEVSACGRRTDYMSYFAFIAGETTCNLAKNFQCHVFESQKADEAKSILCNIAQGFERTQWFL